MFSFYPTISPDMEFLVDRKARKRQITSIVIFIAALVSFGFFVWPKEPMIRQIQEKIEPKSDSLNRTSEIPIAPPTSMKKEITKTRPTITNVEPIQPKQPDSIEPAKPDVIARSVSPKSLQIVLETPSSSQVVVKSPTLTVFIWDLDLIDRSDPITKFTHIFKDDYIRKEISFMALELDKLPEVSNLMKLPGAETAGY